jgi:hypothetical protein
MIKQVNDSVQINLIDISDVNFKMLAYANSVLGKIKIEKARKDVSEGRFTEGVENFFEKLKLKRKNAI